MAIYCRYDKGRSAKIDFFDRDAELALSAKSDYFIFLLREGSLTFHIEDDVRVIAGPCALMLNEREEALFNPVGGLDARAIQFHPSFLNVNITYELINSGEYEDMKSRYGFVPLTMFTERNDRFWGCLPLDYDTHDRLSDFFQSFQSAVREQSDRRWTCRGRLNLNLILEILHQRYLQYGQPDISYEVRDPHRWVPLLLEQIHLKYSEPVSLSTLSRFIGINKTTVSLCFKEYTGMVVSEYVLRYRLRCARYALATTELKVSEIGEHCGFNSAAYFVKQFRARTGYTPNEYRKWIVNRRKAEFAARQP